MRVRYTYVREVYMLKILFYSFMIDRFCLKIYKNPIKFILMRKKIRKNIWWLQKIYISLQRNYYTMTL